MGDVSDDHTCTSSLRNFLFPSWTVYIENGIEIGCFQLLLGKIAGPYIPGGYTVETAS